MKKNKIIILFIYLIILIVSLCGCGSKEDDGKIDKKIQSEIDYLDKKLIGIMNKLNNITLENYEVKSKEIVSQNGQQSNQEGSGGSSGSGQSSGGGSSSGGSSDGNTSSGGGSSNQSSGSGEESNNIKVLQMQPSNILVINKDEIDWITIKSETEIMYTSWNSIILDLYNSNIENEDILAFSKTLDDAILAVKTEDKKKSLEVLANLYSLLPKYINKIEVDESLKNIIQTKSNILNAYALVENENWTEVQNQINLADTAYSKVTNDIKYIENRQGEVSRIYILIKELKNSINSKDKDIFYIKYKNLMNLIQ